MGADLWAAVQSLRRELDDINEHGVTADAATRTIKTRAALARQGTWKEILRGLAGVMVEPQRKSLVVS